MSDILIIKCNYKLKPDTMEAVRENIINQKAEGVIILPLGFDAVVVPDDVELKFEGTVAAEPTDKKCWDCKHDPYLGNFRRFPCSVCINKDMFERKVK